MVAVLQNTIFIIYSSRGCFIFSSKIRPDFENLVKSVITDLGRKWTKEVEWCVITLDIWKIIEYMYVFYTLFIYSVKQYQLAKMLFILKFVQ
jgi:hypothetical protein